MRRRETALIEINSGAMAFGDWSRPNFPDQKLAESRSRHIRRRPVCGVAMQASKSREVLDNSDTFECLSCPHGDPRRQIAAAGEWHLSASPDKGGARQ
jgi:hypothetical protein